VLADCWPKLKNGTTRSAVFEIEEVFQLDLRMTKAD
jgi:hypothetical protein